MIEPVESTQGGLNLKVLRKLLGGISQEELARRINVSAQTISRWERGSKGRLTLDQIKALEEQLSSVGRSFQDLNSLS